MAEVVPMIEEVVSNWPLFGGMILLIWGLSLAAGIGFAAGWHLACWLGRKLKPSCLISVKGFRDSRPSETRRVLVLGKRIVWQGRPLTKEKRKRWLRSSYFPT